MKDCAPAPCAPKQLNEANGGRAGRPHAVSRWALIFGMLLVGCGESDRPPPFPTHNTGGSQGSGGRQGSGGSGAICEESDEEFCARLGAECGPLAGTDACGVEREVDDCGSCEGNATCNLDESPGQCECPAVTEEELCEAAASTCGPLETVDPCGMERTIESCGECVAPETCGGGGEPGTCGCVDAIDEEQACAEHAAVCGELAVLDACGVQHVVSCGLEEEVCSGFDTCGGGQAPNVCGCTPTTCAAEELMCGERADLCGGTITCDQFCIQTVRAGVDHVCAIGSGALRCWGRNQGGQLGIGNTTNQQNPAVVPGLPPITDVAPGGRHTCVLTEAGAVHCWGRNDRGQLGVGTTVGSTSVGAAAETDGATAVVAGADHACALVAGGVRCWGSNDYGQIGNAQLVYESTATVPNVVTGLASGVVSIAAGLHHNCALKNDGTVWCWGRNHFGQLGTLEATPGLTARINPTTCEAMSAWAFEGSNNSSLDGYTRYGIPVQVGGLQPDIVELALGENISCARSSDGEVRCWGALTRPHSATSPCNPVAGLTPSHCAIWPPAGMEGALPIARFTEAACAGNPSNVVQHVFVSRAALVPTTVTTGALSVSAGMQHLCFLVDEQDAEKTNIRCMGRNTFGQVGDGTDNPWPFLVDVFLDSNENVVRGLQTALGASFTCARTGDDSAQCWGSNEHGQIGNSALDRNESFRPFDVRLIYVP